MHLQRRPPKPRPGILKRKQATRWDRLRDANRCPLPQPNWQVDVGVLSQNDDVFNDHVLGEDTLIEADCHYKYLSAADDALASDLDDAATEKSFDDDVENNHVFNNTHAEADTLSCNSSLGNDNDEDNDGVDEYDGTPTSSAIVDKHIADHVLVCDVGTAGLLRDRLDVEDSDTTAIDQTKPDEISISDVLGDTITFMLRQRSLRMNINDILLPKSCRDHRPSILHHWSVLVRPRGTK